MAQENSNSTTSSSNSTSEIPPLKLYNTLTKKKELFVPKNGNKVGMYVCGITAYDLSHIGHARAYVAFDVLFRYLNELGYEVTYVRNFTDVDDKIIKRANERKSENPEDPLNDPLALSNHFCEEFHKDMDDLQCLRPTHEPRVSTHMDQIIRMIEKIIDKGYAYVLDGGNFEVNENDDGYVLVNENDDGNVEDTSNSKKTGDVYFSVEKLQSYGQLSGRKLEDNKAGGRVAVDSRKKHPADFALWKSAKPGEISWNSPWGPGRPGWHIECSAMSAEYLTHSFDIHGGGMDLIFPHHENELAQSCAACEETHISYWLHNGFVTIKDSKMSKSLNNFFTIRQVTENYHPLALRYFLLGMNYNSPVNYSLAEIDLASDALFRVYQTLQDCRDALLPFQENSAEKAKAKSKQPSKPSDAEILVKEFYIKMSEDLNTSDILRGSLQDALKCINTELNGLKKKPKHQKLLAVRSLTELEAAVRKVLNVLGLLSVASYSEVLQRLKEKALTRAKMTEEEVSQMIEERAEARRNKDFSRSDQVRNELTAKGISLMDLPTGTVWRPCVAEGITEGEDDVPEGKEEGPAATA